MKTLVERLRSLGSQGLFTDTAEGEAMLDAADRIEALEVVLEPFARVGDELRPDDADTMRPAAAQAIHFRAASKELPKKERDHG